MTLLVFAHPLEAVAFIDKLNLKKENISLSNVYSRSDYILIVTGEGISNVISKLTNIITIYGDSIFQILNFGVAGRLDSKLELNKCYEINSVKMSDKKYLLDESEKGIRCITSHQSVSGKTEAENLLENGQVVDMELWAIVDVALAFNKPVRSVKLLSDDVWEEVSIEEIKKNAKFYSEQLFDYFSKHF